MRVGLAVQVGKDVIDGIGCLPSISILCVVTGVFALVVLVIHLRGIRGGVVLTIHGSIVSNQDNGFVTWMGKLVIFRALLMNRWSTVRSLSALCSAQAKCAASKACRP